MLLFEVEIFAVGGRGISAGEAIINVKIGCSGNGDMANQLPTKFQSGQSATQVDKKLHHITEQPPRRLMIFFTGQTSQYDALLLCICAGHVQLSHRCSSNII